MATAAVDVPFLSSHYGLQDSTLTALTQEPTVELVNQLLKSIEKKARETEELKSDKLRLEVELENAVRSGETKVRAVKASSEKGLKELSSLRTKLQDAGKLYSQCCQETRTL
jgi:nucleoprotein TPR